MFSFLLNIYSQKKAIVLEENLKISKKIIQPTQVTNPSIGLEWNMALVPWGALSPTPFLRVNRPNFFEKCSVKFSVLRYLSIDTKFTAYFGCQHSECFKNGANFLNIIGYTFPHLKLKTFLAGKKHWSFLFYNLRVICEMFWKG